MATPRKRYFRVPDSVLREDWTDSQLATLIRLQAYLNTRCWRDGLSAEEACRATLSVGALRLITARGRRDIAEISLRDLGEIVSISIRSLGDVIEIYWPKFAEFQYLRTRGLPGECPANAPSVSDSDSGSKKKKKKEQSEPARAQRSRRLGVGFTDAPEALALPAEIRDRLWAWAAKNYKTLPRERLGVIVASCFDWHRQRGIQAKDWEAAARNWVRREMIGKPGPPGGPRLSRQLEAEGRRNREDAEALASALGDWVPAKGEEQ